MREKKIPSSKPQEILLDIEEIKFMRGNKAEQKYISILKKMDGNKRVKIGAELYEMARKIVLSSIKNKNPGISEEQLNKMLKERMQQ